MGVLFPNVCMLSAFSFDFELWRINININNNEILNKVLCNLVSVYFSF